MSGSPGSFGRRREAEKSEVPKPGEQEPVQVPAGLRLVDGRLVLEVDLIPVVPVDVLQQLYDQVRDVVALAFADGVAASTGQEPKDVDEVLPPDGEESGGS